MKKATPFEGRAVIPRATYRLQLHKGFDFDAARSVLPYLRRLGVSHLYCSPITTARPGSMHGYDVVDHAQINPELGGKAGFERFAAAAHELDLGLLVDLVPNHMGVFGADNRWWMDVLENGRASEYAHCFDIDWQPSNPALQNKLLVPLLGDQFGAVLERGELHCELDQRDGALALTYHEHRCPLDPRTYPLVLAGALASLARSGQGEGALAELSAGFGSLPDRDRLNPGDGVRRRAEQRVLQRRLAALLLREASTRAAVTAGLDHINSASGCELLDEIHAAQAYRLAYWRLASGEINYRRFFDINELAALRVEDEGVFEATHALALDMAARGVVQGVRIDHPDGLRDPAQYFDRLQRGYLQRTQKGGALGSAASSEPRALDLYVVAEKIAASYEEVPQTWALHGTTGYRFAMVVNGLFVERRSKKALQRIWRECDPSHSDFEAIKFAAKRAVAVGALRSELTRLARALQSIALSDRRTRDYSLSDLSDALADVAASMPVYRTYVVQSASAQDRRFIDWAVAQAKQRSELSDASIFDFIRRCLLLDVPDHVPQGGPTGIEEDSARANLAHGGDFAARFQQFCAPVAAKGVEDTAFYRFYRLASLNEVGADPEAFGISASAFHGANADRAERWPHTMLATSTHDNKRSEDVRNRINVLSEHPAALRLALRRWRRLTRPYLSNRDADAGESPSAADQYLLLQTLLGTFPTAQLGAQERETFRERIQGYMLKAAREAKVNTSWSRPNSPYEAALSAYVSGVLGPEASPAVNFLRERCSRVAWCGALNSLSMTVLKLCVPGVPDIYQGTELIDLSLVDPDNRRPVAYGTRDALLTGFERAWNQPHEGTPPQARLLTSLMSALASGGDEGGLKLWLLWRLLAVRREHPALFSSGGYSALRVTGAKRAHAVAFARRYRDMTLIVIAARKFASLGEGERIGAYEGAVWVGTTVQWPAWLTKAAVAHDALCGGARQLPSESIELVDALRLLPVAVWYVEHGPK